MLLTSVSRFDFWFLDCFTINPLSLIIFTLSSLSDQFYKSLSFDINHYLFKWERNVWKTTSAQLDLFFLFVKKGHSFSTWQFLFSSFFFNICFSRFYVWKVSILKFPSNFWIFLIKKMKKFWPIFWWKSRFFLGIFHKIGVAIKLI